MPEHRALGRVSSRRWLWLAWLLLALLLAQTSALMHRVAHGSGGLARAHSATALPHTGVDLGALWGEHGKPADCQLLDDLAHATPPQWTSSLDAAARLQIPPATRWVSAHTAAQRRYHAQAPPVSV